MKRWKTWAKRLALLALAGCLAYLIGWTLPVYPDFFKTFYVEGRLEWLLADEEGLLYPDTEGLERLRWAAELDGRTFAARPTGAYRIQGRTEDAVYCCTARRADPPEREAGETYRDVALWTRQDGDSAGAGFFWGGRYYEARGDALEPETAPEDMLDNCLALCREMIDRALDGGSDNGDMEDLS